MVTVGNRKVVVVNMDGNLRAVGGVCAHQAGPVWMGGIFDDVRARVEDGQVVEYVARQRGVIACPWHGWEYELETGRCLWNSRYRIATYRVERDGEDGLAIWI